jgi:TolB-like protein/tetratricopeptide (TPR) repeat protein
MSFIPLEKRAIACSCSEMESAPIISFEDFQIDLKRGELRKGRDVVPVEPQVLDLIIYLATNPGTIISRDDLIETVWSGRIVSDSAISSRINAARAALDDDGQAQRLIKTIPRKGYRFEAKIHEEAAAPRKTLPDKPSVAVLPFRNLSGDPEQSYFSDGITDDVLTDLSRYAELFVIARHSSFAFRDADMSAGQVAHELGVQYIVEGSVRRAGNRIRVTVQLVDAEVGNQLWAERYDRELKDIFEVQDEITSVIVNRLVGEISRQHYRRSLVKSSDTVNAYDHVLRALDYIWKFDPDGNRKAITEAERALELDPSAARAHAVISWAYLHFYNNGFTDDLTATSRKCADAARASVAADEREPWAHTVMGWTHQWIDRSTDRALAELDQAVSLNPASVYFRSLRAFSFTYAGRSEAALLELEAAMNLNPHFPLSYHIFCGRALFNLERYAEAVPHLERVRAAQPNHPNALALAAACYAANGQLEEAYATSSEVKKANAKFTIGFARTVLPYEEDEERDRFLSMLEIAGLAP